MTFQFDKLTNKSQSLLLDAESRAGARQNPEIVPLHLLDAMLNESEGIMRPMLDAMSVDVPKLTELVEVELDLVRRTADRLIAGELKLLNQVLVRVLGHPAPLVGVQEHIVDVERSTDKAGVRVDTLGLLEVARLGCVILSGSDSPQHVLEVVHLEDNLDLVVLEGNERDSKTRVLAVPELQRNVKGRGREGITVDAARSAHGGTSVADRFSFLATAGSEVGQIGGVTNHLVVTSFLVLVHGKLVPDVHPVTILTVNTLTTNLNLYLSNQLLTREIQPTGINGTGGTLHVLINLGKSYLKVGTVSKITVSADGAGYTATKVGLTRKGLFNAFHSKVSVTSVRYFPESDFGGSGKEHVLGAIGNKLH